jgi:hypothetical protein
VEVGGAGGVTRDAELVVRLGVPGGEAGDLACAGAGPASDDQVGEGLGMGDRGAAFVALERQVQIREGVVTSGGAASRGGQEDPNGL